MGSGATCSIGFITSRQQRKDIYGGDIHGVWKLQSMIFVKGIL
jgi:hypothetical protein